MSDDLVPRLRDYADWKTGVQWEKDLFKGAADEITTLRQKVADLNAAGVKMAVSSNKMMRYFTRDTPNDVKQAGLALVIRDLDPHCLAWDEESKNAKYEHLQVVISQEPKEPTNG